MRCNFYLRNPNPKIKGRTAIYLTATYRGQRCILYPGESIDKDDWDNKKFKPKPIAVNNGLIGRLNRFEQLVRDTHDNLQKNIKGIVPKQQLMKAVNDTIRPAESQDEVISKPISVTEYFQTLIDDSLCGKRRTEDDLDLNPNSVKPYKSAMRHFAKFQSSQCRKFYLTDVNQKVIKDFADYLNNIMSLNASAKYLTVFKLLLSYAAENKLLDYVTVSSFKFIIRREKSDNIYLTEAEIKGMMAIKEFATPVYEVVRDFFVISCSTGLRFADFSVLRVEDVKGDFIEFDPSKNRRIIRAVTKVIIPILPMFKEILEKYPNGFPKCPANQVFNRYIKEIAKQVPTLDKEFLKKITRSHKVEIETYQKWQKVSAHTARRSFCTNMYLRGDIKIPTIMALSGHRTQENFLKYIKADNQKHAEIVKKAFENDKIN